MKHLLSAADLDRDAALSILDEAARLKEALLGREVRERMRTLSPTFREALWLFVVEGLSIREIAHILDIPEATVKTRIHRAKAQLRDQLNPSGGIHALA